jgi:endonuclease YncB( thermonuclease family)
VSRLRTQFVLLSLVASTITSGRSLKHSKRYVPQQEEAKSARRNIWSQKNPTPPWEFRRIRSSNDREKSHIIL